jgi:putative ABC transport system permease protein
LADADALLRRVRSVRQVAPLALGTGRARYRDRSREITVVGTTREWLGVRNMGMQTGRFLPAGATDRNRHVCVIGSKIQAELFSNRNPLGEILRLGDERFRIIGVTAPRGVSLGMDMNDVVYVPVSRALKMFNRASLFRILVETRSHEEIDKTRAGVLEVLKQRHDHIEDITVLTQDSVVSTFGRILGILTAALAGIAAISLTVAGVGIMNVMLVSVSERTKEIGLLKALGATQTQLLLVFLVEAVILSTSGGLLGLAIGLGAAGTFRALFPSFPAEPPVWAIWSAISVSFSVGVLFGALPARRAARLDPVVALAKK